MPKKSHVWNHFTPVIDDNGTIVGKAKCKYCTDNKDFDPKAGTTNMWRHFLKHFTRIVPDDQGDEKGIVQCKVCQAKLKASADTSSLVQHVEACNSKGAAALGASRPLAVQTRAYQSGSGSSSMDLEPADLGAQPPPLPSAPSRPGGSSSGGEVPDMEEPSKRLARMIALHGYDPSIVEDDCFKSFVESLNPEFRVPKRVEIEDLCDHIFDEAKKDRNRRMDDKCRGRTSLAVDKAKIMEREVMYTVHHFVDDDWNLHKVIMGIDLDGPSLYHHGKLDERVESDLEEIVSNWLDEGEFSGDTFMMAWGITKDHSTLEGSINQNLHNTYAVRRGLVCTTFMDVMFHSVAEHIYLQMDAQYREDMHARIFITRKRREKLLSHAGVDLWAYKEAWYSCYCDLVVFHNEVPDEYMELPRLLCNIWGPIYRAIKIVSTPNLPTSNLCLLELFNVKKILETELALASGGRTNHHRGCNYFIDSKDVTTVLTELIDILDKAIQDSYLVWSIPLVLDPRYNLARVKYIFKEAFGEAADSYISKSTEHIKVLYSDYVEQKFDKERQGSEESDEESDEECQLAEEFDDCQRAETFDEKFPRLAEVFDDRQRAQAQAELGHYLNLPLVHPIEDFDILDWWKVYGSRHYPTVALMARDALAMPTSSQLSSEQIAHVKSSLRGYSKSISVLSW